MRYREIHKRDLIMIIGPELWELCKYKVPTINDICQRQANGKTCKVTPAHVIALALTTVTYALVLRIVLINVGNGDVRGVRDVVGGARLASLSSTILHI